MRPFFALLALLGLTACGSAEIVAPSLLVVVDTFPAQGAVLAAGEVPVVVTFSEGVDEASLERGVTVALTSRTGTVIRRLDLALDAYDRNRHTATFSVEPLQADSTFLLVVDHTIVVATSEARLSASVERRFATAP